MNRLNKRELDLVEELFLKVAPDLVVTCLNKKINSHDAFDWAISSFVYALNSLNELKTKKTNEELTMLDKELADQLTKQEKSGIEYHFLELLPKIVESQHCINSGFIEGASKELINTLAKTVISFREEDEQTDENCCKDDNDSCADCCNETDEEISKPFSFSQEQRLAILNVWSLLDELSFRDIEEFIGFIINSKKIKS